MYLGGPAPALIRTLYQLNWWRKQYSETNQEKGKNRPQTYQDNKKLDVSSNFIRKNNIIPRFSNKQHKL